MQIKNRYTDAVIFEDDKPTLRETVLNAVAQKAYLAVVDERNERSRILNRIAATLKVPEGEDPISWAEQIKTSEDNLRNLNVEAKLLQVKFQLERDEALAEAAKRYDCHGGPGTTEPACRACVTCLLRDLEALKQILQAWLDKQGHDRCWYYPDLFRELAAVLGITSTKQPGLPVLSEFQEGCRRYQGEEYRLPFAPSRGALAIVAERQRQMTAEGWTPEHDAEHVNGEMAMAAACYAAPELIFVPRMPASGILSERSGENFISAWPWDAQYDKRGKQTRRRALEKAGALCAAELDRLDAAEEKDAALRDKQALKQGEL